MSERVNDGGNGYGAVFGRSYCIPHSDSLTHNHSPTGHRQTDHRPPTTDHQPRCDLATQGDIYSQCIKEEVVLPVVHRLHHAICLDFYNRMAADATSDIWVHSNAISKHMATKGGYYGSILRGLNNFSKIL